MRLPIGTIVLAKWAVGPLTQGSGWVWPRYAKEFDRYRIVEDSGYGYTVVAADRPNGMHIAIYDGQFLVENGICHSRQRGKVRNEQHYYGD